MSRDGTNRVKSKYWWKDVEQQYGKEYVPTGDTWFSYEWLIWKTNKFPDQIVKRGSQPKMRSTIGKENPNRIWYWDEKQPGTKHYAHRWERRVGKTRVIREQLMESD